MQISLPIRYLYSRSVKLEPTLRLPSFSHFPLHDSLKKFLEAREIHTPTYVQYALMTKLYSKTNIDFRHHIVSPTGSGKTLAYMLPMFDLLKKQEESAEGPLTRSQRPRALILTSNKQLVLQVRNVGKDISHFSKLKCEGIGIGRTLSEEKQKMQSGLDVLVSSYTRLKRMLDHNEVYLSNLSWVVVDEIDTLFESQKSMVDQLFNTIISTRIQKQGTNFTFASTTNPPPLTDYLHKKLPNLSQIIDKNTHVNLQNIKHEFLYCPSYDKHEPLLQEMKRGRKCKTMVFCNTVGSLHELEYFLNQQGIMTITLHSQLSKEARLRNYQLFRDSENGLMLSTDLGARGLHFPKLQKVINYDFPLSTCDYLQRAGRTGRAGQKGTVVSLYFKKHLPVINELKDASFNTPLKVNNSAYGFKNREETKHPSKYKK